tara:strand:- start:2289 stop:2894 length:606 start_codon:yes stop_codon:yes gene_type:complete
MRSKLNIISNNKTNSFFNKLLVKYELVFIKLDSIDCKKQNIQANIVIMNNEKDIDKINLSKLNENYLIISNSKNKKKISLNNQLKFLEVPTTINNFKNKIENFIQNLKVQFHDITIVREKLINLKNNSFCYLTKVEIEILTHLIREKETNKKFIKENILKIKSNIETNSLESHLTRIRKKMNKIESVTKIQSRNEKLLITN